MPGPSLMPTPEVLGKPTFVASPPKREISDIPPPPAPVSAVPAPPPKPPLRDSNSTLVELVFKAENGSYKAVNFEKGKFIGIDFGKQMPVSITRVKDPAESLGVRAGWVLTHIGGQPLEGLSFDHAFLVMKSQMAHPRNLQCIFGTPEGQDVTVYFTRQLQLGLNFGKKLPIVVSHVREPALSLGVQPGWTLKRLGQADFMAMSDFEEAYSTFRTKLNEDVSTTDGSDLADRDDPDSPLRQVPEGSGTGATPDVIAKLGSGVAAEPPAPLGREGSDGSWTNMDGSERAEPAGSGANEGSAPLTREESAWSYDAV